MKKQPCKINKIYEGYLRLYKLTDGKVNLTYSIGQVTLPVLFGFLYNVVFGLMQPDTIKVIDVE